ncbi:hypothetical protein KDAU_29480 [Dictyobacter aurantiacus]|uniref:Uncharacterized protein n=1 Tax=Dictyobacter aurantiacus TaxID=1936993 RepID=A0A401ZFI9_9CHLR|nr:hypothetical protein KDAU_29480 [Dictyobacter aurantiacus]
MLQGPSGKKATILHANVNFCFMRLILSGVTIQVMPTASMFFLVLVQNMVGLADHVLHQHKNNFALRSRAQAFEREGVLNSY